MSTPPPPSPERRVLHERTPSERNRLQIRLVPYSPPRLSSDAEGAPVSPSSRTVSRAACSPSSPSSRPVHGRGRGHDDESHDQENNQSLHVQGGNLTHGFRSQLCSSPPITRTCVVPSPSSSAHADGTAHATSGSSLNAQKSAAAVFARLSNGSQPSASPSPSPSPSPSSSWRRPKKVIVSVHSDKTFSLLHQADSKADSPRSPHLSSTVPSSSYDLSFSDFLGDGRCSSPLTPLHEQSPRLTSPRSGDLDPSSSSPWNYRFVGGLRKVHGSASGSSQVLPTEASCSGKSDRAPAYLPEARLANLSSVARFHAKRPCRSSQSGSTSSERSNYQTFPHSSPALTAAGANVASSEADFESLPPTSSHSNIDILGESSSDQSVDDQQRPETGESEANYLIHGDQSPSSSVLVSPRSGLRSEYSRESLLVPPLRTAKRNAGHHRQPVLCKSRSRESIRSGSLTSISTILIEEATRSLFGAAATVHMPGGVLRQKPSPRPFNTGSAFQQHPWSSTLSTVMSESEGGNDGPSRSLSPLSGHGRHSSQAGGVSPFLNEVEEAQTQPCLTADRSPVSPPAAYCRLPNENYSTVRLVRDHDEHGDGLADLEALHHHRPPHTRLYSFLSNYSSDRNLCSSGSARSNSFSQSAIPAWARLYYGSGERRFLAAQPSSDSLFSEFNAGPPGVVSHSRSPSTEQPTAAIHNPRRHPRDATVSKGRDGPGANEVRPFTDATQPGEVKKQTSSVWSPHLGWDKRIRRYSIWQPPSAVWSTENRSHYSHNPQPILFVIGFIFPFAWMLAAFLPLPPKPQVEMEENHLHTDRLDLRNRANHHMQWTIEARHYSRAQWWRALNRAMAIVGIFVVGAIVALIVTGVRQKWGS